ncbi:hypothetical protein A3Q56_04556 [Intoshia linei]|uniref:Uncharacterized protein n=1 Tax=Intoshia linei TaxID=1819745 RepID=A0A177B035_9BILA|nr:hypothetical protein A3Q56_04556 [Intoshia linei]
MFNRLTDYKKNTESINLKEKPKDENLNWVKDNIPSSSMILDKVADFVEELDEEVPKNRTKLD